MNSPTSRIVGVGPEQQQLREPPLGFPYDNEEERAKFVDWSYLDFAAMEARLASRGLATRISTRKQRRLAAQRRRRAG